MLSQNERRSIAQKCRSLAEQASMVANELRARDHDHDIAGYLQVSIMHLHRVAQWLDSRTKSSDDVPPWAEDETQAEHREKQRLRAELKTWGITKQLEKEK